MSRLVKSSSNPLSFVSLWVLGRTCFYVLEAHTQERVCALDGWDLRASKRGRKVGSSISNCGVHREWEKEWKAGPGRWLAISLAGDETAELDLETGNRVKSTIMIPWLAWPVGFQGNSRLGDGRQDKRMG